MVVKGFVDGATVAVDGDDNGVDAAGVVVSNGDANVVVCVLQCW